MTESTRTQVIGYEVELWEGGRGGPTLEICPEDCCAGAYDINLAELINWLRENRPELLEPPKTRWTLSEKRLLEHGVLKHLQVGSGLKVRVSQIIGLAKVLGIHHRIPVELEGTKLVIGGSAIELKAGKAEVPLDAVVLDEADLAGDKKMLSAMNSLFTTVLRGGERRALRIMADWLKVYPETRRAAMEYLKAYPPVARSPSEPCHGSGTRGTFTIALSDEQYRKLKNRDSFHEELLVFGREQTFRLIIQRDDATAAP